MFVFNQPDITNNPTLTQMKEDICLLAASTIVCVLGLVQRNRCNVRKTPIEMLYWWQLMLARIIRYLYNVYN